jgi:heterodisulfide reductase subunit A
MINFALNGQTAQAEEGETILDVAKRHKIEIPTLCHHQALDAYGGCRLCVVEIKYGKRTRIVTSCNYEVWEGIEVQTDSERVRKSRRMTLELLLSRCPEVETLRNLAAEYGLDEPRFAKRSDDCILCGLCVRICKERMGVGAADMVGRGAEMQVDTPYHRGSEVCLTCGACASVCPTGSVRLEAVYANRPVPQLSEFDMGLRARPSIYIPFPQAVPNTPVIDRDNCVHFLTGACKTCETFCPAGAIDYGQEDEVVEIDAGAAILAPGYCQFDAGQKLELGYAWYPNVLTSLQFERLLSASGPYGGHIVRPSDHKEPQRVAFIQCVGSREEEHDYCSSVCCMYATKQSIIAMEHQPGLSCEVFYMDMRAFGKGFELYYERAKELGVTYTRCRPSSVEEDENTGDLNIGYVDEDGKYRTQAFDLVVLSTGLCPPEAVKDLAAKFDVKLGANGFAVTKRLDPVQTSRPGVFVCGPFSEPKDIPETVMEASSASAKAMALLAEERGKLVREREWPPEKDVRGQPPRIGVFVCHCGRNIGGVVDVPAVRDYAETLPDVVYATDSLYTCSIDTQEAIKQAIEEYGLNRVVVASCTPRTHEPLFRDTIREAGLNPYLFEMANIRDQCSWVHQAQPAEATEKSKDLVRSAVAKARKLEPLQTVSVPIKSGALVVGGGMAGICAALNMADQGFEVNLVEKEAQLGGHFARTRFLLEGGDPAEELAERVRKIENHPKVRVWKGAEVRKIDGFMGNFITTISQGEKETQVEHGAVVLATGAAELTPEEYLYGEDERVLTQRDLEERLADGKFDAERVVMIQCVGSREGERMYCSRVCCSHAVKNALKIKELSPGTDVVVLYRELRTYGFREQFYTEARQKGVRFVRYDVEKKPVVSKGDQRLRVEVTDPILRRDLVIDCDLLALSPAIVPREGAEQIAQMLKVPLTKEKFFLEAHMKLRPVDFSVDGVYVAGMCHGPKDVSEAVSQAEAAASRAATVISKKEYQPEAIVSTVDEEVCSGCGICVSACSYDAPQIVTVRGRSFSRINPALCKGCGACASACPSGAAQQLGFRPKQITEMVGAVLE